MSMQVFKVGKEVFAVTRPGDNRLYTVGYKEESGWTSLHEPFPVGDDDLPRGPPQAVSVPVVTPDVLAASVAAAVKTKAKSEGGTKSIFGVKITDTQYAHILIRDYVWSALKAAPAQSPNAAHHGKQYWELDDDAKASMQVIALDALMVKLKPYIRKLYEENELDDAEKLLKLKEFNKKVKAYIRSQGHWWSNSFSAKDKPTKTCAGCKVRDYSSKKRHPVTKDDDKSDAERAKSLRKEILMAQHFARDGLLPTYDPETGGSWVGSRASKEPIPDEPEKGKKQSKFVGYFDQSDSPIVSGGGGGGGGGASGATGATGASGGDATDDESSASGSDTESDSSSSSDSDSDAPAPAPAPKPVAVATPLQTPAKRNRSHHKSSKRKNKGESSSKKPRKE